MQDNTLATYAAKIEKEDCKIDFNLDSKIVSARIRGVTPIPGAFAFLNGKMLKICRVKAVAHGGGNPGLVTEINGVGDGSFTVSCQSGSIIVTSVKPEGKGIMSAGDFIRGRKIEKGNMLD